MSHILSIPGFIPIAICNLYTLDHSFPNYIYPAQLKGISFSV